MKYINIEWKLMLEDKKIRYGIIVFIIISIFYGLFNYTTIFNPIKYKILTHYSISQMNKDADDIYELKALEIQNTYNKKLSLLKKEYDENIKKEQENIIKIKTQYKEAIPKEYKEVLLNNKTNIKLSKILNITFKTDIYKLVNNDSDININESILKKINNGYKENKKTTLLLNTSVPKIIKEDNTEKKKIIEKKKIVIKSESVIFNYNIKKEDGDIVILDRDKINNVLPFGITFPSFFSYRANGIGVLRGYFDLHYGVDYKTTPYTYLKLYNFKDKKSKVLISDYSPYGNKIVLGSKDSTGSERFEYLHLYSLNVKAGQDLKGGEKIGVTGKSGYITGPHLHFVYFRNGFYTPFDWGIDIKNKIILKEMKFSDDEISKIIKLGKENTLNMELVSLLYDELPENNRKISNLDKIVNVFITNEKQNKYRLQNFINDKKIKALFGKKTTKTIVRNVIKKGDKFHQLKKDKILNYLKEHKDNINNLIYFDKNLLGNTYIPDKEKEKINIKGKIDYKSCKNYDSNILNNYVNLIKDKNIYLNKEQIKNINKIIPFILEYLDNGKIVTDINENLKNNNTYINKCDILYLELGKFYWGNDFYLKNINKNGIFYNLNKIYDIKGNLSDNNIKEQIKDSINNSISKIRGLINLSKNNKIGIGNDFILKFWLWSFNGIIGQNPNEDYYVSNNLFKTEILPNRDSYNEEKDGAYTMAIKLYFNK